MHEEIVELRRRKFAELSLMDEWVIIRNLSRTSLLLGWNSQFRSITKNYEYLDGEEEGRGNWQKYKRRIIEEEREISNTSEPYKTI